MVTFQTLPLPGTLPTSQVLKNSSFLQMPTDFLLHTSISTQTYTTLASSFHLQSLPWPSSLARWGRDYVSKALYPPHPDTAEHTVWYKWCSRSTTATKEKGQSFFGLLIPQGEVHIIAVQTSWHIELKWQMCFIALADMFQQYRMLLVREQVGYFLEGSRVYKGVSSHKISVPPTLTHWRKQRH